MRNLVVALGRIIEKTPDLPECVDFKNEINRIRHLALVKSTREDLMLSTVKAYQKLFNGKQKEDMVEWELELIESFIGKPREADTTNEKDTLE